MKILVTLVTAALVSVSFSACFSKSTTSGDGASPAPNSTGISTPTGLSTAQIASFSVTGTATPAANSCIELAVLGLDSSGTNVFAAADATFSLGITGGAHGALYSDAYCSQALGGSQTLTAGLGQVIVYFKDSLPEAVSIAASFNSVAGPAWAYTLAGESFQVLVTVSGTHSAVCEAISVELEGAGGYAPQSMGNLTMTIGNNGDGGPGHLYSNSNCGAPTSTVTILPGGYNAAGTLYMNSNNITTPTDMAISLPLPNGTTYTTTISISQ